VYIFDPTTEQLNAWYRCSPKLAKYFVLRIPIIHIDKKTGDHYFVKTKIWKQVYKEMPFWAKILEKIL